jgi:hypothetical protein
MPCRGDILPAWSNGMGRVACVSGVEGDST